jgi:hypothetical protein
MKRVLSLSFQAATDGFKTSGLLFEFTPNH